MNIKAFALIAILGLAAPAITDLVINPQAHANEPQLTEPLGGFSDGLWTVSLWQENNLYHYSVKNNQTGATLFLSSPEQSIDGDNRVYTWRSNFNNYQVSWQPSNPRMINLQVIAPNGKQVLNRLLPKRFN
ncbi:hypothetical protein H6F96_07600 [Microcoleus sp. FACHB-53]|jgi:hypothetical protein|nr:hypothetical protein [Microcoleus sp. FACHB-53]MBD2127652.1 hypothetical protein [Microcoleus sp. FACHB-1]